MQPHLLKDLTPPLLVRSLRRWQPPRRRFFGVLDSPAEIPGPRPWGEPGYIAKVADRLRESIAAPRPDPDTLHTALFVSSLASGGVCSVLDFAGGAGVVYHQVSRFVRSKERLRWDVVDNPSLVEIGLRHCGSDDRLRFFTALPDEATRYDVIHVNTSLQYLDEPYAVLDRLCQHRPTWILLTRLLAGDMPTFLTSQEVEGVRVPCWFLNVAELRRHLKRNGFELAFRAPVIDGSFDEWFDPSVPPALRAESAIHTLFRRV